MLQFDELGHLKPTGTTELTLPAFELFFVENLDDRAHRRRLFENYLLFLAELKKVVGPTFYQWVDGSFVSQKARPADLDVVTFTDLQTNVQHEHDFIAMRARARIDWKMDANFAVDWDKNMPMPQGFLKTTEFWQRFYGFSRPDINQVKHPKGFIRLNFE